MLIKVVFTDADKKTSTSVFQTGDNCAAEGDTLLSSLQEHCSQVFKIPIEACRLLNWKGRTLASGRQSKYLTLKDAGLQHLDKVRIVRAPTLLEPIQPSPAELCGPPIRVQRRSITVQEGNSVKVITEERVVSPPSKRAKERKIYKSREGSQVVLKRNATPYDNNSLYHCISELLFDGQEPTSSVRWLCAESLSKRPDVFTKDVLKAPIAEYGKRIFNPKSWGGYIELSCIALEYQVGFCAWNTLRNKLDVYGEDYEDKNGRYYLIYDGTHYDWVSARDPDTDQTYRLFSSKDPIILRQLEQLSSTGPTSHLRAPVQTRVVQPASGLRDVPQISPASDLSGVLTYAAKTKTLLAPVTVPAAKRTCVGDVNHIPLRQDNHVHVKHTDPRVIHCSGSASKQRISASNDPPTCPECHQALPANSAK